MESTRSKSKPYVTSVNVMAALFFVLLLLGQFYSHSWAVSAAPDIKVNGMDNTVTLASENTLTMTVELNAGEQTGEAADWWIVADTPMGWYCYEYPNGWYFGGDSIRPAYQGSLFNLTEPMDVLCVSGLPVGNYAFYFGVDMNMNGALTGGDALYYDGIEVNISASGGSFPVVDTGQTNCYDDMAEIDCPVAGESFYGQDAQYSGNQPSYADNGDGTVTDNVTGLMWQQSPDTDGDGDIDAADKLSYDEAVAGASSQTTGGYSDWRLPTIKELYSLILFSGVDPSGYDGTDTSGLIPFIDDDTFDFAYGDTSSGERIIDAQYASSNLYVEHRGRQWRHPLRRQLRGWSH